MSAISRTMCALLLGLLVAGCNLKQTGDVEVRFINATTSATALDLYYGTTQFITNVASGSYGGYSDLDAGALEFKVTYTGNTSAIVDTSYTITKDQHYTIVAYGTDNTMKSVLLTDDESSPASGYTKVRVLNGSNDAGTLDLYLTSSAQSIDSAAVTVSAAAAGTATSYTTVSAGTYRLRLVGTGDTSDLRLDLPSLTLPDQGVITLIASGSSGGYLVNAIDAVQQGGTTALPNPSARVRTVAGAGANAGVTASVNGTDIGSAMTSPSIGAYALVTAGTQPVSVIVNNGALATQNATLTAGGDYTLLVYGPATNASTLMLTDDNHLPSSSSKYKMRLVNAEYGANANLTLTVDYTALASNVAYGAVSSYGSAASSSSATVQVTSPSSTAALYSATSVNLAAQSVYTMFVLGDTSTVASVLRKDR